MRTEDLFLKYAQVINMCEGTKVKPWEGVRQPDTGLLHRENRHPDFSMSPENYEFMVAVLEDRPVFVGDELWHKDGHKIVVGKIHKDGNLNHSLLSWNPPKKTVELPCPQKDYSAFNLDLNSWGLHGRKNGKRYYFKSESDLDTVIDALHKLLQDATK